MRNEKIRRNAHAARVDSEKPVVKVPGEDPAVLDQPLGDTLAHVIGAHGHAATLEDIVDAAVVPGV